MLSMFAGTRAPTLFYSVSVYMCNLFSLKVNALESFPFSYFIRKFKDLLLDRASDMLDEP